MLKGEKVKARMKGKLTIQRFFFSLKGVLTHPGYFHTLKTEVFASSVYSYSGGKLALASSPCKKVNR